MQCVLDTGLLFFHLRFGGRADVDLGDTASQLGQTLFQLLFVVVAGSVFDLATNLIDTSLDVAAFTSTFDHGRVVLIDQHLFGTTKIGNCQSFQFFTQSFEDGSSTSQHGNVFHHRFAAIAVARSFNSTHVQRATQTVDNQRLQCLAVNIFCHDQQRLALLNDLLQHRYQVLNVRKLLLED